MALVSSAVHPRDHGVQGDDAYGNPIFRRLAALYAKQGLPTHGDHQGKQWQSLVEETRDGVTIFQAQAWLWLGISRLHQAEPAAEANTPSLKGDFRKQKLLALQKILDVMRG